MKGDRSVAERGSLTRVRAAGEREKGNTGKCSEQEVLFEELGLQERFEVRQRRTICL